MDFLSATQMKQKGGFRLVYKLHRFEIDDDDPVDFVAVTKSNSLIELRSGHRISECSFDFLIVENCSRLSVFQSYNPTDRNYLFMNGNTLVVVVKRGGRLTVRDTIRHVAKYTITDRYLLGKPQVVVQTMDGESDVFDFGARLVAPRNSERRLERGVKLNVLTQIQMLRTRVKTAEEVLQEKAQLVNKYTKSVLMNVDNVDDILGIKDFGKKIPVVGSPIDSPPLRRDSVLEVGSSWVKIIDNRWVIGFQIMNSQETPLTGFQLFAFGRSIDVKETLLFCEQSPEDDSQFEFYSPKDRLNKFQVGFIVGVLNAPHFIEPMIKLECICVCCCTVEHQTYLGPILVNVQDVAKLSLFEPYVSPSDLICIQSIQKQVTIVFENETSGLDKRSFLNSLVDNYKFMAINNSVIVNSIKHTYYSMLIVKNPVENSNNFCFYYKELNQLLVLLHLLRQTWHFTKISPKSVSSSWSSAKCALKEELTFIQNVLFYEMTNDDAIKYSLDHLLNLQTRTATEINALSQ